MNDLASCIWNKGDTIFGNALQDAGNVASYPMAATLAVCGYARMVKPLGQQLCLAGVVITATSAVGVATGSALYRTYQAASDCNQK